MTQPDVPNAPARSILDLLEPDIVRQAEGCVQIFFTVKPEFTIPSGVVQGGLVAAMLDMAMAMASGFAISTASMQFEILRPVTGPRLRVDGNVARRGRRIVFADAEMHDADDRLVARGSQTAVPLAGAPAQGTP